MNAEYNYPNSCHPSHDIEWRDSSHYEFVCKLCNTSDNSSGWGYLRLPCKANKTWPEKESPRYALRSQEEIWVDCCSLFFQLYGDFDWYRVPYKNALQFMLKQSNGQANITFFEKRLKDLYKGAGIF